MPTTPADIAAAADRLRAGGLVAFPTETVYGLGADALSPAAVARVFAAKGRPPANPLIVHVSGPAAAARVAADWPRRAQLLADAFWPGPLTIVVPASPILPPAVTAAGPGVAVRCPDHPMAIALLLAFGGPVVAPSANISGSVSPTTADHVRAAFSPRDAMVLDGGPCPGGIESTIVSLLHPRAAILRPGPVAPADIARVLGEPVDAAEPTAPPPTPSPGSFARHYAPRTPAVLLDSDRLQAALAAAPERVAVLAISPIEPPPPHALIAMPPDPEAYARRLYAALRDADALGVSRILIERPESPGPLWDAIRDRLTRAADHADA